MQQQNVIDLTVSKVLMKIFAYYQMDAKNEYLKETWREDLKMYSASEIQAGWDSYRKSENGSKKPKSWDIARCIRDQKKYTALTRPEFVYVPLKRGVSAVQDMLIDDLKTMEESNPSLSLDIKKTNDGAEKAILCASALRKPHILAHPAIKILIQRFDERQNNNAL